MTETVEVTYGAISVIPALFLIVASVWTKRVIEPLLFAAILCFLISDKLNFVDALVNSMVAQWKAEAGTYTLVLLIGAFIAILQASGGAIALGRNLIKFCNTHNRSVICTWILGIIVFLNAYMTSLTINAAMKPVCDKNKVPREMLSYVIDSTSMPVTVMVPVTPTALFYIGVLASQTAVAAIDPTGDGVWFYMHSAPYFFYPITTLIIVPLVALGVIPRLGAMKSAYKRVADTGMVYSEKSAIHNEDSVDLDKNAEMKGNMLDFILPLVLVIILSLTWSMSPAILCGITLAAVMYLPRKILTPSGLVSTFIKGLASMTDMILIFILVFMVKDGLTIIQFPTYIIELLTPIMNNPALVPALAFICVVPLAFVTGSSWGIPALSIPIMIPLAETCGANLFLTFGAILSAATVGGHACFYSDLTVLSAKYGGIDVFEHAYSQIPYAIISALLSLILYLIFGFIV